MWIYPLGNQPFFIIFNSRYKILSIKNLKKKIHLKKPIFLNLKSADMKIQKLYTTNHFNAAFFRSNDRSIIFYHRH
jgi:hypothetical protein